MGHISICGYLLFIRNIFKYYGNKKMNKLIIAPLCTIISTACISAPLTAILHTQALNTLGIHGQQSYITTLHTAQVTNDSDIMQLVTVSYAICADNKGCDYSHHYRVKINPHAIWKDGIALHKYPTYNFAGHYAITGSTSISGNGINQIYPSTGYIDVR